MLFKYNGILCQCTAPIDTSRFKKIKYLKLGIGGGRLTNLPLLPAQNVSLNVFPNFYIE